VKALTVKALPGTKADLGAFAEQVASDKPIKSDSQEALDRLAQREDEECFLDANKIIPYPERFAEADRKYAEAWNNKIPKVKDGYNNGGYKWCCTNWGTKWGFCDVSRATRPRSIKYWFSTAWSPPLPLIKRLGEMFPQLSFDLRYWEGAMGFQGKYVISGGEVITDVCTNDYRGNKGG
jgi:hypothetical protein